MRCFALAPCLDCYNKTSMSAFGRRVAGRQCSASIPRKAEGSASWNAELIAEIDALVAERVAARQAKDYAKSDRLRDELSARGVEVMDSASGSTWRRKG
jgi:cysteinyl-tRNA synthetase